MEKCEYSMFVFIRKREVSSSRKTKKNATAASSSISSVVKQGTKCLFRWSRSPKWNGTVWEPRLVVISIVIRDSPGREKPSIVCARGKPSERVRRDGSRSFDLLHIPYHFESRTRDSFLHLSHAYPYPRPLFLFNNELFHLERAIPHRLYSILWTRGASI